MHMVTPVVGSAPIVPRPTLPRRYCLEMFSIFMTVSLISYFFLRKKIFLLCDPLCSLRLCAKMLFFFFTRSLEALEEARRASLLCETLCSLWLCARLHFFLTSKQTFIKDFHFLPQLASQGFFSYEATKHSKKHEGIFF